MHGEIADGGVGTRIRRKKGWLAVTLPLLAVGLSACGSESPTQSQAQSDAGKSASQSSSTASSAGDGSGGSESTTAAGTVETFVTRVVTERYKKACMTLAPPDTPENVVKSRCANPDSWAILQSLNKAWTKPGVTLPPEAKVEVTNVTKKNGTATVPDTAITLDGRTLREIELMGSQGDTKSFSIALKLQKDGGNWHLSDVKMSF